VYVESKSMAITEGPLKPCVIIIVGFKGSRSKLRVEIGGYVRLSTVMTSYWIGLELPYKEGYI
jgi:hypothetical protein